MTDATRWSRIQDLCHDALQRDPSERAAFLATACAGDADLQREVESLLAGDGAVDRFLGTSALEQIAHDMTVEATPSLIGQSVGVYAIEALIGSGGMGEVYRARDTKLRRQVAIKRLGTRVDPDESGVVRFHREARAVAALNHPNIVTIHAIEEVDGQPLIVMELVEGTTLAALVPPDGLPLDAVLTYAIPLADALAAAHAQGITHRDLKPSNVMVTNDGRVKVLDFGLAKLQADGGPGEVTGTRELTGGAQVVGTTSYMSPEQASGRPVDHRTDLFSFGVVLYEMATGRRPFAGDSSVAVLAAILKDAPTPVTERRPDLPREFSRIVLRALAKDPGERYQSAAELRGDLQAQQEAIAVPRVSADAAPGTDARLEPADAPPAAGASGGFVTRHRRGITAGAIAALAAIAVSGWLWQSRRIAAIEPRLPLVAVRAFRNLSPDPSQSYFAAGMTEEIAGQLSQLSALRVLSRGTTARYADGETRRMADEFGVKGVVEGSVRLDGSRIRIAVQLVDAPTQQTVWSEQYDHDLADVFAIQSDVAVRIASTLQATLSASERARVEKRPTRNMEAYQLYLRSRSATSVRTENVAQIARLRRALELDPQFAAAQAQLAYHLIFQSEYDGRALLDEGLVEAKAAAQKDPTLATVHSTLAYGYSLKGMDRPSRLSYLRALDLAPNSMVSMMNLSIHDQLFGRLDESLHWASRAFGLMDKNPLGFYHVAAPLLSLRDDDLSERWLVEGERQFPRVGRVHLVRAALEVLRGRDADAMSRMARLVERTPEDEEATAVRSEVAFLTDSPALESLLEPVMASARDAQSDFPIETPRLRYAHALRKRGETARAAALVTEAKHAAQQAIDAGNETPVWRVEMAAIHALNGDQPAAILEIGRAYDAGYRDYGFLERDPILAPLRGDRGFRAAIDRMRRDVDAQRQAARDRGLLDLDALLARPR